jgi:hypothetical protein
VAQPSQSQWQKKEPFVLIMQDALPQIKTFLQPVGLSGRAPDLLI